MGLSGDAFQHVIIFSCGDHFFWIPRAVRVNPDLGQQVRCVDAITSCGNHLARKERCDMPHDGKQTCAALTAKS